MTTTPVKHILYTICASLGTRLMEACIEIITSIEEPSTECQIYICIFILPSSSSLHFIHGKYLRGWNSEIFIFLYFHSCSVFRFYKFFETWVPFHPVLLFLTFFVMKNHQFLACFVINERFMIYVYRYVMRVLTKLVALPCAKRESHEDFYS